MWKVEGNNQLYPEILIVIAIDIVKSLSPSLWFSSFGFSRKIGAFAVIICDLCATLKAQGKFFFKPYFMLDSLTLFLKYSFLFYFIF